ncbi:hypothetical protein P9112_014303 [Eukaryota sp. TZLM1-RC]
MSEHLSPGKPYLRPHTEGQPGSPPMTFASPRKSLEKGVGASPGVHLEAPGPILPSSEPNPHFRALTPSERKESGRLVHHGLVSPPRSTSSIGRGAFIRPMPQELESVSIAEILSMEQDAEKSPKARMGLLWKLVSAYIPNDQSSILRHIASHLEFSLARSRFSYDPGALFLATAYSVRDRLIQFWNDTAQHFNSSVTKRAYYLSIEYLMGRQLLNALVNLDVLGEYRAALLQLGFPLEYLCDEEKDAALGNGGLGRLAACMLDSAATLDLPVWGYGLRYKYGMFRQELNRGYQRELPDFWLTSDNPWLIERSDVQYEIQFYGSVSAEDAEHRASWAAGQTILACAHDFPIPGFGTYNTTNLRLWSSRPSKEFDLASFNAGEYYKIVEQRQDAEQLCSVLYPDDSSEPGRVLRLKQQYFFVAASIADIMRRFKKTVGPNPNFERFPDLNSIQLNDTHPSLAIPELLRVLMDIERLPFQKAFPIVQRCFNYTCHTLLPEALEKWPVRTLKELLPRHLQLIMLINHHHLENCRQVLGEAHASIPHLSLVEEDVDKMVRMANLCVVGSSTVNGVARMHGELMKRYVFKHFSLLDDSKFVSITNGFTQRRWLLLSNPHLAQVISDCLGSDEWMIKLEGLQKLRAFADDDNFQQMWRSAKLKAKKRFAEWMERELKVKVDPQEYMFDVMVKRIHEYKRQLMNVLAVISYYLKIRAMSSAERARLVKRCVLIGGKAAPGYYRAKVIIKLITAVQDVINADVECSKVLKLVFVPNYCVSVAEMIIPAADVSQHISTAGTRDGASVEIAEEIGEENVFFFGMSENDVEQTRASVGKGEPVHIDQRLKVAIAAIESGTFGNPDIFQDIIGDVKAGTDFYCVAADFSAYVDMLDQVRVAYKDQRSFTRRSILTAAGMSKFSSDRMTQDYASQIWKVRPERLPEPVYSEDSRLMVSSTVPREVKSYISPTTGEKISEASLPEQEPEFGIGT